MHRKLALTALLLGLSLPFLGKPVHLDDANFLVLAQGAALDPWRPHAIEINWQGTTQAAFEVLSNPPGIGWWLAPVVGAGDVVQHLWMLLWLPLAVLGAWRLGDRLAAGRGAAAAILLVGSPVAVLAAQSRMPDLPLLACALAGMGGVVQAGGWRRKLPWAVMLGSAALFRYSGAALVPLVPLAWLALGEWRGRKTSPWPGLLALSLAAAAPLCLLMLHDLAAYGQPHVLAMVGFQQETGDSSRDLLRKLIAAVAMLGGAGVLPLLCWGRGRVALGGTLAGAALGLLGVQLSAQTGLPALGTVLFAAAGGATLSVGVARPRPETTLLLAWLWGGLIFLLALRFSAARYWLPFLAPAVLLPLRTAPRPLVAAACLLTPLLSLFLAVDDLELARAQDTLAATVQTHGTGLVAGHWGFQHHLEAAGWQALEEDQTVPEGVLLAVSTVSWPQTPGPGCLAPVDRLTVADRWPGPRVHTRQGAANLHAFVLAGSPPIESYAPWGFGDDPQDEVRLWRGCGAPEH